MLHHMKLKSAVAKLQPLIDQGATVEAIEAELKKEEHGYSAEDQMEIMTALHETNKEKGTGGAKDPKANQKNGSDLDGKATPKFDYENLKGDHFKNYMKHVLSLNGNDKKLFQLMRVEVIRKVRYRGVKDSQVDIVGVRIKDSKPIHTTLIPVKHATSQNGFIKEDEDGEFFELVGSQVADNNRFYLLKQD